MSEEGGFILGLWWIASVIAGGCVGELRGRAAAGLALGVFLGPVGVIVAGLLPPTARSQLRRQEELEEERARLVTERQHAAEDEQARRERAEALGRAAREKQQRAAREAEARRRAEQERAARPVTVTCPVCTHKNTCRADAKTLTCSVCNTVLSAKPARGRAHEG